MILVLSLGLFEGGSTALVQERPPPGDRVSNDELGSIDEGLYHGVTFTSVMSYILEQM